MIIFGVFAIVVAYFIWKSLQDDEKKRDEAIDEYHKRMWKGFVIAIENEHFRYPLTPELRNWVLSNREFGWKTLNTSMPKDVKHQFDRFSV